MGGAKVHSLLQINLHHSKAATANINRLLLAMDGTFISLIQEPYFFKKKVRGLRAAGKLFSCSSGDKPRTCVLTSLDVKASVLPGFSTGDLVAIMTEWETGKVVYASVYMPYDQICPPAKAAELVQYCAVNQIRLVLGCDSNAQAHHSLWGSSNCNPRGESLCEFVGSSGLCCINRVQKPTFVISNRQEVIDITMVSADLVNYVRKWWVDDEPSLSDHRLIRAEICLGHPDPMFYRNKR